MEHTAPQEGCKQNQADHRAYFYPISSQRNKAAASVTPARRLKQAVLLHNRVDAVTFLYFAGRKKEVAVIWGAQMTWNRSWEDSSIVAGPAWEKILIQSQGEGDRHGVLAGGDCFTSLAGEAEGFRCFPITAVAITTPWCWQLLSTTHAPGEGRGLGTPTPGRQRGGRGSSLSPSEEEEGPRHNPQPRFLLSASFTTPASRRGPSSPHRQRRKPWHSCSAHTHAEDPHQRLGSSSSSSSFIIRGDFWQFCSPPQLASAHVLGENLVLVTGTVTQRATRTVCPLLTRSSHAFPSSRRWLSAQVAPHVLQRDRQKLERSQGALARGLAVPRHPEAGPLCGAAGSRTRWWHGRLVGSSGRFCSARRCSRGRSGEPEARNQKQGC